jgi:uncharacterized protein YprB with RNaseH-like and TPR domain
VITVRAEDLHDRLRRLRREGSDARDAVEMRDRRPSDPAGVDAREPGSLRGALARHDALRRRLAPARDVESTTLSGAGRSSGMPSGIERVEQGGRALLARRETFARDHRHGDVQLADVARSDSHAVALLARDPALATISLEHALYLDTETSGLAGGAGTYVFMVGLGSFAEREFRVWQGFLDDPAHERDLLAECAERIRNAPAIVSFFGKSFDRHRLEDRMRCLGIDPPFDGKAHLDLYHPLRRLYRGAFADHRLRTLERALCGLERDDDLPGSFAPAAWFDFLAARPHRLEGVFRHNRDDVLSLVTLGAHLGAVLCDGEHESARELIALRAANLARALLERGDARRALCVCTDALDLARRGAPNHVELDERRWRELRFVRAELLRENGDRASAICALRELACEPEDERTAAVLLALARLEAGNIREPGEIGQLAAARATLERAALVSARRHTGRELARLEREMRKLEARIERKERARSRPPRRSA